MIDIATVRAELETVISATNLTIYRDGAIDGTPALPAVVIGNPRWEPGKGPGSCRDLWSWPIAVLVARDGTSDPVANRELDAAWPQVAQLVDQACRSGIAGAVGRVTEGRFGPFTFAGVTFPGYVITAELT